MNRFEHKQTPKALEFLNRYMVSTGTLCFAVSIYFQKASLNPGDLSGNLGDAFLILGIALLVMSIVVLILGIYYSNKYKL